MNQFKPTIQLMDPEKLTPYANNTKKHPTEQIDKIAGQIASVGFTQPILVDSNNVIIACHGRREAARRLGLKEVPVIVANHLSEEQIKAYRIADNRVAQSDWDEDTLRFEFGTLDRASFDLRQTGFDQDEIDRIMLREDPSDEGGGGNGDPDEVPAAPLIVKSKLGDLYELGEHRLLCGNSSLTSDIEKLTYQKKIDLVFTDPPYGISIVKRHAVGVSSKVGFVSPTGAPSQIAKARQYREVIGDDIPFDPSIILGLDAKVKIVWGANHFASKLPDFPQWLVWDKKLESGTLDHNNFSDCELAWTNQTAKSTKIYRHTWAGMLRVGDRKAELKDRVHPTQKPVGLCSEILSDFSDEGAVVLDLFGGSGSGSALIACEKTKRKCFMMELDPHYIDVIVTRYVKFTGNNMIKLNGIEMEWV